MFLTKINWALISNCVIIAQGNVPRSDTSLVFYSAISEIVMGTNVLI